MIRIALVHDYLVHIRGGERVLWLLGEIFSSAEIYVLVHDLRAIPAEWQAKKIRASFVQKLPFGASRFRLWLPLYPYAVEQFDLREYDLVISCSSGFAHGAITQPQTCHICYSLSPIRYAWSWYHELLADANPLTRVLMSIMLHRTRQWDRLASSRVDYYAAISRETQQRLRKFYRRDAPIIHPPVDVSGFRLADEIDDYYLIVSALVPYKRVDIAIEVFNDMGVPLKIIGVGPELDRLKAIAQPNIEFLGRLPDEQVRRYYSRCRAFVFTAREDFGITPVEAQASGRPVIAYRAGGALETVADGVTGLFFSEQTADSLTEAMARFDPADFDPQVIQAHAARFDIPVFKGEMRAFVRAKLAEYRSNFDLPPVRWPEEKKPL